MKLLFASHNQHKTKEISLLFKGLAEVVSLNDIGIFEEIEEYGKTLHENALIKAEAVYKLTGLNCFADDTGLLVDALNGAPGVYSARYAGPEKDPEANNTLLLKELADKSDRKAKFVTVICLIQNGIPTFFEGQLSGEIISQRKGSGGFGYDPVFMPEGFDVTLAELSPEEKNAISHRGRAFQKLSEYLMQNKNQTL